MKRHEVQKELAKALEEIDIMAGKSDDEGFKKELYEALVENAEKLAAQIERIDNAQNLARKLVRVAPGQGSVPKAPFNAATYGKVKNFQTREIDGQTVRAEDQAYAAGQWFFATFFNRSDSAEWCKNNGIMIQRAQGEGVDQAGGFLVPEQMMDTIITLRESYGVFRQQCQLIPMARDTLNWPRLASDLSAAFVGENAVMGTGQVGVDNVNVTAKKLGVTVPFSTEIAEDAIVPFGDWLTGRIAYAFALKEDACGFNGDGTSTYGKMRGTTWLASGVAGKGGLTGGNFTTTSKTLNAIVLKDLTSTMGMLPQYAITNAKWYMSQQMFYQAVASITAGAGGNRLDVLTQGIEKRLLGFPVIFSQALPITNSTSTGDVQFHFGDLALAAIMGERRGLTIKRSEHRFIDQDQIGLFATERFDINVHDIGVSPNGTTTPGSPLVSAVAP